MSSLHTFKKFLCDELQSIPALKNANCQLAYPEMNSPSCFKEDIILVDISEIALKDSAINRLYTQVAEMTGNLQNRDIELKATLSVYVPDHTGGIHCHNLLSAICDHILFEMDFDILSIKCGKILYNKNIHAYTVDCVLHLQVNLLKEDV